MLNYDPLNKKRRVSIGANERLKLVIFLLAESADNYQVLRAAKSSMLLAIVDYFFGETRPNPRKYHQLSFVRSVYVDARVVA